MATGATALALLCAATACGVTPPPEAWVLTPISYDNRLDADPGPPEFVDATFPMSLTGDTEGGFWGESAGSWVHIDATGAAVRRFNLDPDAPRGAVAAVTPTVLAVAAGERIPSYPGSVLLFDTETMTWELLHSDERAFGDIAAAGDALYFVAYTFGEPTFTIQKLALTPGATPVTVSPAVEGFGSVALDVDQQGALYVATSTERIVVESDGTIRVREPIRSTRPAVAVNARGDAAWSGQVPPTGTPRTFVSGGSADARRIIDAHRECDLEHFGSPSGGHDRLTLDDPATLLLCSPAGFTWINDRELVASVGNEGGASLVRITPPE